MKTHSKAEFQTRLVLRAATAALLLTLADPPSVSAAGAAPAVTPAIAEQGVTAPEWSVRVDPRVELFSLLFRLAGNPEYNQCKVESYSADAESHFHSYQDHPAVKLARELRRTRGVSYDACMSMAVHVNDAYELQPIVRLDPWPEDLDSRWTPDSVSRFLALARQFLQDTSFRDFITAHQPLYEVTIARLQSFMEQETHLEWFPDYFGERPQARFTVVPGLLNGGGCYGARCVDPAGNEQLFCILGVWRTDMEGLPEFTSGMAGTVVHEFCHSYANAIMDRHREELEAAGGKLYRRVEDKMRSQAYGTAQTMLRESLVRACTVRYHHRYGGAYAAERAVDYETQRGFLWTGELSDLLAQYEAQRDRYPTLEAFAPRIVSLFNEYAAKLEQETPASSSEAPRVVSMTPANGAENVDAGTSEIRVTFDRPMRDGSWAMVGGGPHHPETTGRPRYDTQRTTWSVPVKLKPDWRYEFYLNRGRYDSFRSEEGVPLKPVRVRFTTGGAAASPLDAPPKRSEEPAQPRSLAPGATDGFSIPKSPG